MIGSCNTNTPVFIREKRVGNLQILAPILNLILSYNLNIMNMIIYEVNLSIELELESAFIPWLKEHIEKMLKLKGFVSASLLKDMEDITMSANWVVQYKIESRMDLDNYFDNHAKEMRQAALDRFCDGF